MGPSVSRAAPWTVLLAQPGAAPFRSSKPFKTPSSPSSLNCRLQAQFFSEILFLESLTALSGAAHIPRCCCSSCPTAAHPISQLTCLCNQAEITPHRRVKPAWRVASAPLCCLNTVQKQLHSTITPVRSSEVPQGQTTRQQRHRPPHSLQDFPPRPFPFTNTNGFSFPKLPELKPRRLCCLALSPHCPCPLRAHGPQGGQHKLHWDATHNTDKSANEC